MKETKISNIRKRSLAHCKFSKGGYACGMTMKSSKTECKCNIFGV